MGTWGIGVWQDDVAQDVIDMFQDLLKEGCTATEAVQRVLEAPPWGWDDEEGAVRQVLALAVLALQHGVMEPSLRDQAIVTIDSEVSLWLWESAKPEVAGARKELLSHLKDLVVKGSATDEVIMNITSPKAYSL